MTKNRKVTRSDLEELEEKSIRLLEMSCGQTFERKMEKGEIEDRARELDIPYQDAFREIHAEAYEPLAAAHQKRRELEQRYGQLDTARMLGVEPPARPAIETEEEERERWGFTNAEAEACAKRHGLSYTDAVTKLSEERRAEISAHYEGQGRGPSAVFLSEEADKDLDRRAWAYAEKHGVSYREALSKITGEEGI